MEAIRLQPGAAIAWSNLAGLFKDEGQVATSVAYYREALRLAPSCADFYSNLGAALQDQRNLGEARTCFETALELRSDYAVARGNLGACLLAQGEYAGAVKSLRQALQLEPNFPDAFNNLGSALSALAKGDDPGTRQQHLDESVASYRACLRLQPDHPHAYSNLGVALQKRGMVSGAVPESIRKHGPARFDTVERASGTVEGHPREGPKPRLWTVGEAVSGAFAISSPVPLRFRLRCLSTGPGTLQRPFRGGLRRRGDAVLDMRLWDRRRHHLRGQSPPPPPGAVAGPDAGLSPSPGLPPEQSPRPWTNGLWVAGVAFLPPACPLSERTSNRPFSTFNFFDF
ncbi:hypothetical protein M885DRAFT_173805 [Pelagophyceae sp. CCMP2097]|nr:hypothetical protein M885DRAFT_173805 [Pelagophyceae sp. CCMP2097]